MYDSAEPSPLRLNRGEYRDKVLGCWTGKNIGGTLGGPFEGRTEMNDAAFYVQDLQGQPAPNDDLDLQLAWLLAAEERGIYGIDERVLGEYWLSHVSGPWNEYGVGKANMRAGLTPPLSGSCNNECWRISNGAWIRSEIWACLFPGSPDEAAQYAYYDACCDHCGDGIYAEVFTAVMESAAFIESDIGALIRLGLSRIPENSRVARAVKVACAAHEAGLPFADARAAVVKDSEDLGWFQAPGNLGFVVLGLLYGAGDFGRCVALATNCGDDADCTAGTVGALLGIVQGRARLPRRWIEPIGESIQTCAIDTYGRNTPRPVPKTVGELADRVVALAEEAQRGNGALPVFVDGPTALDAAYREKLGDNAKVVERVWKRSPYELKFNLPHGLLSADYKNGPYAAPGEPCEITFRVGGLRFIEKLAMVRLRLPEGWRAVGSDEGVLNVSHGHYPGVTLTFVPGEFSGAYAYLPVDVRLGDRLVPWTANLPLQRRGAVIYYASETYRDYWDARNRVVSRLPRL